MNQAVTAYKQAFTLGCASSADPLAKLWREEGDYEAAIDVWRSALEDFPAHSDRLRWWQGLTNSLRATGQWEAGILAVNRALQEFPEDARLYVEKGAIVYGRSADATTAMKAINTAIALDNTVVGAYGTAGSIMAAEQQYEAAYNWYTEASSRDPSTPSWYVARGHMARAAGDLPLALDAFLVAIERFPNFSPAYFGIARVYRQLDDQENAVAAVNQALQVAVRKSVQDYLSAGEIYEWSGNVNEAIAVYRQALALDPNNAPAAQALQRLKANN